MLASIIVLLSLSPLVFLSVLLKTHFSSDELNAMGISMDKQSPEC